MTRPTPEPTLPSWTDIPDLDLYLDQVLSIVTEAFQGFEADPSSRILTGSMINNYVKHRVMPAPKQKRYRRRHVATLFMILVMKSALPLDQVRAVIETVRSEAAETLGTDDSDTVMAHVYARFRISLSAAAATILAVPPGDVPQRAEPLPTDGPMTAADRTVYWASVAMCARLAAVRLAAAFDEPPE